MTQMNKLHRRLCKFDRGFLTRLKNMMSTNSNQDVSYLNTPTSRIAYRKVDGHGPGVIYIHGYQSDMNSRKAAFLEEICVKNKQAFVRYDNTGNGLSSGDMATNGTIGQWQKDLDAVIDNLTTGPQILVGSSMGGFVMVLTALARPEKVHSLIGVAAAIDYPKWKQFSKRATKDMSEKGKATWITEYGEMSMHNMFITEAMNHLVLEGDSLSLACPVRLLHGMADIYVPYDLSLKVANKLKTKDVEVILRKGSDHSFSNPEDLLLLQDTLEKLSKIKCDSNL